MEEDYKEIIYYTSTGPKMRKVKKRKEDKPKKKAGRPKRELPYMATPDMINYIFRNMSNKSVNQLSNELGISPYSINKIITYIANN